MIGIFSRFIDFFFYSQLAEDFFSISLNRIYYVCGHIHHIYIHNLHPSTFQLQLDSRYLKYLQGSSVIFGKQSKLYGKLIFKYARGVQSFPNYIAIALESASVCNRVAKHGCKRTCHRGVVQENLGLGVEAITLRVNSSVSEWHVIFQLFILRCTYPQMFLLIIVAS